MTGHSIPSSISSQKSAPSFSSSSLTHSALAVNQEVNVSISVDDPRYDELVSLFGEYWAQARVLDKEHLKIYAAVFERWQWKKNEQLFEETLRSKQGRISIGNISRGFGDLKGSNRWPEAAFSSDERPGRIFPFFQIPGSDFKVDAKTIFHHQAAITLSDPFRLDLDLRLTTISTSRSSTLSIWIR